MVRWRWGLLDMYGGVFFGYRAFSGMVGWESLNMVTFLNGVSSFQAAGRTLVMDVGLFCAVMLVVLWFGDGVAHKC